MADGKKDTRTLRATESEYSGYGVEVDCVDRECWDRLLRGFADANIYQTWAWGTVRSGDRGVSHLVVRRASDVVAAVQARIRRIPGLNVGIAYVRWGPLWRPRGGEPNQDALRAIVSAMKREFVDGRGLYLRVLPYAFKGVLPDVGAIFESVGLERRDSQERTLLLPLDEPLDAIRKNMSQNWRKNLSIAERKGLSLLEGSDEQLFDMIDGLCADVRSRKPWVQRVHIAQYRELQKRLPMYAKLKLIVCGLGNTPVAGLIGCAIGDVGIELVAASGSAGLDVRGSYLLRWKMAQYLKESGCRLYDLNGVNPTRNPGGYQFKSGLSGKGGCDVQFVGEFDACRNPFSHLVMKVGGIARDVGRAGVGSLLKKMGHS